MAKNNFKDRPELSVSVKSRWEKLEPIKSSYLKRARDCSAITIPSLIPPEGSSASTDYPTPYQSAGAEGVRNLAAKLLISLFPPNQPFFKLSVDEALEDEMVEADAAQGGEGLKSNVKEALTRIERTVASEVEVQAFRVQVFESLRYLIVSGNTLIFMPDTGGIKIYRLDQYCVKRDPMGNVIEIVIKERIHPAALPDEVFGQLEDKKKTQEDPLDIYTHVVRVNNKLMYKRQECEDIIIPKSEGTFPIEECPYIALRWTAVSGEDYGRGHVEEYLGDIKSLEALSKAIVEGSLAAARLLFMVNPNGTTNIKNLSSAKNGDFVTGNRDDITTFQLEKFADFQVAKAEADKLEQRLARVFLQFTSIQRNGERVTAEEIRRLAKELEDSLGGVYSVLAQEMQLPLVKRLLKRMAKEKRLPALPPTIQPMITTGLEALGRGNDLDKLSLFSQALVTSPVAHEVPAYLETPEFIGRLAVALGIDKKGLVKTRQEVEASMRANQMNAMLQTAAPGVIQEVVKGAVANGNQTQASVGQ